MNINKTYTIKDISKELCVSRGTIDRVIHNRGGISEDTVKRVKEYLEKVNYKSNKIGKSLARRLNKSIYVILPGADNNFYDDVKQGIQSVAEDIRDFGFKVNILEANMNSEQQIEMLHAAVKNSADAIAIAPFEPDKFVDVVDEYINKGIPIMTFNNDIINSSRLCYVGINYYKSGRLAAEVLGKTVKTGTVAMFTCRNNYWQDHQRILGFRESIDGFPCIKVIGPYKNMRDYDSAYHGTKEIIEASQDLNGIMLFDNQKDIVAGVCKAVSDISVKGIDIVTFDLISECKKQIKNGTMTAVIGQQPFKQGYYSVKVLFNYLFDNKMPNNVIFSTGLSVIFNENIDNYEGGETTI